MRPAVVRLWMLGALALVLTVVDHSIAGKERIRRQGEVVYLELLPVDPRSLMQGDYMALRFALADELERGAAPTDRAAWPVRTAALREGSVAWAPIRLDARGVASLAPGGEGAGLRLRWRVRSGHAWLGTNAFFFEEGEAPRYAPARYGEFRLDRETGEAVLVGLRDADLRPLGGQGAAAPPPSPR